MLRKTVLASAICVAVSCQAFSQDSNLSAGVEPSFPGSVFLLPQEGGTPVDPDIDPEIMSDIGIFRARGFSEPDWQTHTAQVDDVLKNVVLPDWRKRTGGKGDPDLPSIDIAAENILGGDYNDLLVMSRLPEDCGPTGCLFQLYSLVNEIWIKRFEFKTISFAWKPDNDGIPVVAQVGGMWIPSKTYIWSGGRLH